MPTKTGDQRGFTLIELMLVVGIMGIVASIAVPNFLRYQMQTRQSEARANLGGIFVAETSFFGEMSRYSSFYEVGFALAGGANRYNYYSYGTSQATGGTISVGSQQVIVATFGVQTPDNTVVPSATSQYGFTATATANLDNDVTVDQWHVNDIKQNLQTPDVNDVTG